MDIYLLQCFLLNHLFCLGTSIENKLPINVCLFLNKKSYSIDLNVYIYASRLGRSPGEGKGYPLQYFGLENSMDCIVHGVAKSRT